MRGHYRPRVPTPRNNKVQYEEANSHDADAPTIDASTRTAFLYVITSNVGILRRDQAVEAGVSTDDVVDDNVQDEPFRPAATDADVDNGSCSMMFDWVKSPAVLMLYQ
jgi:hypothetical protein